MVAMEISGKIMLLNLPAPIAAALAQQLGEAITEDAGEALLVIAAGAGDALPRAAVPLLPLRTDRPQRLGAILRQARQMIEEPALFLQPFALGPYEFNTQEKTLARAGRDDVMLTDKEVDILLHLARLAPAAVQREDLLRDVWRYQGGVDTHTLETHIYRLRQKIEETADAPQLLVTEGRGYRLNLS